MPAADDVVPDLLLVGHATRDLVPGGGWRLGGTVVYAALTALRLGKRPAIVTAASPDVLAALTALAPEIPVAAVPSPTSTTFENHYALDGRRHQHLRARAANLTLADIPAPWRAAPLVLLAPLAQEIAADLAAAFPHARVAATPQGWLRQWDATGLVSPCAWTDAPVALPHLAALILSHEDLPADHLPASPTPPTATSPGVVTARWAEAVPVLVVTRGADGADLWQGSHREHYPAYTIREMDPTGAGDVFAAAFLCHWQDTADPRQAVAFANCTASFVVEHPGLEGIPTLAQVLARLHATG